MIFLVNSSAVLLTSSFGGNGDLWCAGGLNFSYYIQKLDKKFDIKTATIIFLFSSLKVTARLQECLPSFLPGGKLCDWVINTLMDPAGTVSSNLICKEIIWVIDGDEQFLSDKSALSLALQKIFESFLPQKKKRWSQGKWGQTSSFKLAFNCPSWSLFQKSAKGHTPPALFFS